ncbi:aminoacyl tRNA synthase complex-interacting multifunctional protein 1 [Epinephelus lanceolatus]|uniref:aminoacyl tRNA synthase complex-interacting multifunctional protein 1 n=1 Tax=Epinephelus lanceolatus TaxID=310571 RepID=UPI001447C31F|nr:aminoacyl tRNA synthase complex-interacting multifunctional protein 1 [Epinephelus lanceolatus]
MDNADNLFHPSLAAALMKLDPEDGEQIMEYFKTHALLTREKALLQASVRDQKKLLVENGKLKKDIEQLRAQLQEKQRRRTAKALFSPAPPPPTVSPAPTTPVDQPPSPAGATAAVPSNAPPPSSHDHRDRHSRRRRGDRKARPSSDSFSLEVRPRVDVSRLDLRVGRILSVRQHPLTDAMSVQEVDVGENAPRTVVSKLGVKTNQEELQGSLAVLLCNVKACKLRGVVSQARLLCCSTSDDHTELLTPPTGSTPGDRVTFLNFPGDPDRELQSKQRVWELLQPDLQVDSKGVANYKGCGFEVKGKGLCRAPSLTNCTIR